MAITKQEALTYHLGERPGKIEVTPTKPCRTQRDLSLAYTPGVAVPCLEIEKNPQDAFKYTARGNLVAVISNGTAVLGLGHIGALAGKPVMEGKGVLFKRFADVDVFDLEVDTTNPDEVIKLCQLLEPTFGGINLEDIKAPECFYIEETLKRTMKIPVFHDDQHGTAIISGAALINALELVGKNIEEATIVVNGAGASGIACAKHYLRLGARPDNLILADTKGVIYAGRTEGMNKYKAEFARQTSLRSLAEAVRGCDVLVGLSVKGAFTPDMIRSMAEKPIVFAMANPDPEITYEEARAVRSDLIMCTGRSDYPNQVNNVLGFPFIFRGALDVHASAINDEMKLAATRALADLAREDVADAVCRAYGVDRLHFGPDYIIPKPFDPRVLVWEASAVARAAMETGVAQTPVDLAEYREQLERRLGKAHEIMRFMINKARMQPKRVVFPEGENDKILRACGLIVDENIARPSWPKLSQYVSVFYRLRQRKGITESEARELMLNPNYFGAMMVRLADADALVSGVTQHYPDTIRPALQVIQVRPDIHKVSGLFVVVTRKGGVYFLADTTVNINPTAEDLAEIALCAAQEARRFGLTPRVAMLSFSNYGSTQHPYCKKVRLAVELVREREPGLLIDGEMQADAATSPELLEKNFPFSRLRGGANVLVFPDLAAGNVAYKLLRTLGGAETIGPILMGMNKPVHVLQLGNEVEDIVNITAVAVVDAQEISHRPALAVAAAAGNAAD
jgi:malate dehydrogenase (oxaloacetate-decarboxylating)(NADP+)